MRATLRLLALCLSVGTLASFIPAAAAAERAPAAQKDLTAVLKTGEFLDALPQAERLRAAFEKPSGAAPAPAALDLLAEIYRQLARYKAADALAGRALALREKQAGAQHPSLAEPLALAAEI